MLISSDLDKVTEESNLPAFETKSKTQYLLQSWAVGANFHKHSHILEEPLSAVKPPPNTRTDRVTEREQKVKCAWMHDFTGPFLMSVCDSAKSITISGFIDRVLSASAAMTIRSAILCFTVYEHQRRTARSEQMMDCRDVRER